jgi:hypothetical protein
VLYAGKAGMHRETEFGAFLASALAFVRGNRGRLFFSDVGGYRRSTPRPRRSWPSRAGLCLPAPTVSDAVGSPPAHRFGNCGRSVQKETRRRTTHLRVKIPATGPKYPLQIFPPDAMQCTPCATAPGISRGDPKIPLVMGLNNATVSRCRFGERRIRRRPDSGAGGARRNPVGDSGSPQCIKKPGGAPHTPEFWILPQVQSNPCLSFHRRRASSIRARGSNREKKT